MSTQHQEQYLVEWNRLGIARALIEEHHSDQAEATTRSLKNVPQGHINLYAEAGIVPLVRPSGTTQDRRALCEARKL